MTRKSKRELERSLDDLAGGGDEEIGPIIMNTDLSGPDEEPTWKVLEDPPGEFVDMPVSEIRERFGPLADLPIIDFGRADT